MWSSQTRDGHRSSAPKSGDGVAFAVVWTLKRQNEMSFLSPLEGSTGNLADGSLHTGVMQKMDLAVLEEDFELRILGKTSVALSFYQPRTTFDPTYKDGEIELSPCTRSGSSEILVTTSDAVFKSADGSQTWFLYVMNH